MPDVMLLEDAEDIASWCEFLGRTVPRSWCPEIVAGAVKGWAESFF